MKSFIRYPGGKAKFRTRILDALKAHYDVDEYREPFFGGGGIGFAVLAQQTVSKFWINDLDRGMYCLWRAVLECPDRLQQMVRAFQPEVRHFDEFREYLLNLPDDLDVAEVGFRKLALHQISFSGLGLKSGGPLGGRNQDETTKYPIDCRWSPDHICKQIEVHHHHMQSIDFRISNSDFLPLLVEDNHNALIYLDPPYYDKGGELYHHAFSETDHIRLANALQACPHKWILSYDDCEPIRALYQDWAHIDSFAMNYTIHIPNEGTGKKKQHQKGELLIMPKSMVTQTTSSTLIEI